MSFEVTVLNLYDHDTSTLHSKDVATLNNASD